MTKKNSSNPTGFSTGLPSDYKAQERILAPIPGLVTQVFAKPGERVQTAEPLLIIEAMKMRNMIRSSHALTIEAVHVQPGQVVKAGDLLVVFKKIQA